jgi:nucleotide exchange factor SIL1
MRVPGNALLMWLLLVTPPAIYTSGGTDDDPDENLMSLTDEEFSDAEEDIFVPTKDWQVIREGQHIPRGLHVRMDFQTGVKEAKLLEDGEEEKESRTEDQPQDASEQLSTGMGNRVHYYGQSDRRGVVNKRTKVFSAEEVESMLKDINNDTVDLDNLPQLSSSPSNSDPLSTSHTAHTALLVEEKEHREMTPSALHSQDLPVTRHQDIEDMLGLLSVLANHTSSVAELCHALEELEYYVHQMHNAHDLNAIGGLVLVVRLLNHTHADVKSWAARVIGSASQRYSGSYDL